MFEIHLGRTGAESTVKVNGQDITRLVRAVRVECRAGGLTQLTLESAHVTCDAELQATVEQVTVIPAAADEDSHA